MSSPVFKTFQQILKSLIQEYVYKSGVTDLNKGSVTRSLLEAAALSDYKVQADIMAALNSVDIDRASGLDLDKIGFAKDVMRPQAKAANGVITIYQKGITKVETKIYQGAAAPPAGSLVINVTDISGFPTSGQVYIGRGTNNLEGPIAYTSITPFGSYYQLNLATPTTKNHNTGESVILAQGGNRVIPAGSLVQTKSTLTVSAITFKVVNTVTILDGEDKITDVPVICTQVGTIGNIPAGAIVEFATEPFPNAAATNPLAFVSGRDAMSDEDYRELIKKVEQSKVKGTDLSIIQATVGVSSTDDNKTVTSAQIRKPASRDEPSIVFIDDSTGYQPVFYSQGFEQIIDNANGGETYLQLQHSDVTKALVVTALESPYSVSGNMKLAVKVGGVYYEHTFSPSDFSSAGVADAIEIINSINANTNLPFKAVGIRNNKQIILMAKSYNNEDIQVVPPTSGVDANEYLRFPTTVTYSLRLYKNDNLLVKDGVVPTLYSKPQNAWNNSITNGATLSIQVDGAPIQTITVNNADFVPYGYTSVNKNNSLESWAAVFNSKIAGATFEVEANKLKITSNKGANNKAKLKITGGTLAAGDNMFDLSEAAGRNSDYALNRATGQVQLAEPASPGDVITAGSKYTRGLVDSDTFTAGSTTLASTPTPRLYFIVDAEAERINTSLSNLITVSVTNPSGNIWRYTFSSTNLINNVQKNDWVIITDNMPSLSPNNRGYYRVNDVDASGQWFEIVKTLGTVDTNVPLTGGDDFIFIRSPNGEIRSTTLPTGLQTLTALANAIKAGIKGVSAEVINGKKIRVSTLSYEKEFGRIFFAGHNSSAAPLGFKIGDSDKSEASHTAYNFSQNDSTFIEFFHDRFNTGDNTPPYTSVTTVQNLDALGFEPNGKIAFLNQYNTNISSNRNLIADLENIISNNVSLKNNPTLNEIIPNDRYYVAVPFNFNSKDSISVILDRDPINKTFNIKMARKSKVYASTVANQFQAYDLDFSPTGDFPKSFGDNFSFDNFKIHFRARNELDPAGPNNKILVRATEFGPNGNKIKVGIFYPSNESSSLAGVVQTGSQTLFSIILASGPLRTGGAWDTTTEFDVTNPSPGIWRYTYNGTGTAPNFTAAGILAGDIVRIDSNSTFDPSNTGVYKVSAVTATYFEVIKYTPGMIETGRTLLTASALKFYPLDASANTALSVANYINSDPQSTEYITIQQLESGAGVISTSTFDDSSGAYDRIQLVDGENWVLQSNIGTVLTPLNTFTLKRPLNIFGANLINEEFYLIPTTSEQIERYVNKFVVTGLSTVGNITLNKNAQSIQLYSSLFGSNSSIFVTGGSANKSIAAVKDSAYALGNNHTKFSIVKAASSGFHAGQWVKIQNTELLAKIIKLTPSTNISWASNTPSLGLTTISITNSNASNLYAYGYFWTRRYHNADNTSEFRIERHGRFTALIWTGVGANPYFTRQFNITNIERNSNVSTITLSVPHGVPVGSSIEITVSGVPNPSFNGTFRAVASSATELQYAQVLPNVASTPSSGTATRSIKKTDRIIIGGTAFNPANKGEFIVMGVYSDHTIYFENPISVEETVVLSAASDIEIYDYDSVRPSDLFSVGSSILNSTTPFENHTGSFAVNSLTASETTIIINSPTAQNAANTLGSDFNTIRVIEKDPFITYAKIANIAPSPSDNQASDVIIYGEEAFTKIAPTAGSYIQSMSKLGFKEGLLTGEDSYKYYGGLISEVGKVIRGDPSDPLNYPGVAAAGAYLEVEPPIIKRIKLSVAIRTKTGIAFVVLQNAVESAVISYINNLGVGKNVVFSEIVKAVQNVNGVDSCAIISPIYDALNDQIVVSEGQKPIALKGDIIVSQIT